MGRKFQQWDARSESTPSSYLELTRLLRENRGFSALEKLDYGDHGLASVLNAVEAAIKSGKRIALYADYDVDGTMSCVSWIWFLRAIGYTNYIHYIPCRFSEGYGVNLAAVKHLIDNEGAELIITMDTGITANEEAALAKSRGVEFICTDHHKIQPERMPDCLILNPKMHPDPSYQELCGCGITFVLLRKLAQRFPQLAGANELWTDLVALAGMATICDVVPLNGANHTLVRFGVQALIRSRRLVLRRLREAAAAAEQLDEKDVGFRLGPRINAVGRLQHADTIIAAFLEESPEALIKQMGICNEERKVIQAEIVAAARTLAQGAGDDPILFLGGDFHPGVVGIAASKLVEEFWRPTWLFQRKDGVCKGSARSIAGFDVTEAMVAAGSLFKKFGGHAAAGGFTFAEENEAAIRQALNAHAQKLRLATPELWRSRIIYDCEISPDLAQLQLADELASMRPFGHGFEEPRFLLDAPILNTRFFNDKKTGQPRHTAVTVRMGASSRPQKIMFFNEVLNELTHASRARFVVSASRNTFRGETSLALMGHDVDLAF